MQVTNMTSKGQVTIPKIYRDMFGLMPNNPLSFEVENGKLVVNKYKGKRRGKKPSRGAEMVRWMTGRGYMKMTTDEIMALTRGED